MSDSGDVRGRLLQSIWDQIRALDASNVRNHAAAARAIASGASSEDVVRAMRAASYEMAFGLLFSLSSEHVEEGNDDALTGWMLLEAHLLDSGEVVPNDNGALDSLHESLLSGDPTGLEGRDLFT